VVYQRNFNRFLKHIKIHDLEVLLDFNQKVIKEMIIDYILYLRDERKIANRSIKVHLSAILRFFQKNNDDFNLRINNFDIHLPHDDSINEDRPYTVEEILQILQGQSDLRSKMIILLLCSTGMRIGALHSLQICDLTPLPWLIIIIINYTRFKSTLGLVTNIIHSVLRNAITQLKII
jgi:integrase